MSITISLVELISWIITIISLILTIISVILFIVERRKNVQLPYYMAVQGILRACKDKAGFYGTYGREIEKRDDSKAITKEEHLLLVNTVYSDYKALMEHIMGSLKAILPDQDIPFDTMQFTGRKRENNSRDREIDD